MRRVKAKAKLKLRREKSAGAVIFHRGVRIEYLLLRANYWGFPKGLIEARERENVTALREVKEETGLDVRIVEGFRVEDRFMYRREGALVRKVAVYLLAEAQTRDVQISWEHDEFAWLPFQAALEKLEFKGLRDVLRQAHAFLNS
jgi:8-oxo-dGTP pyrophosphatase MutT (NUDIX family)